MRFLVCNDLHLKPNASDHDVQAMAVPDGVDAALIIGDLTHRDGPDDKRLARSFIEQCSVNCPVWYVPGNHDHVTMPSAVVDPVANAYSGHEAVLNLGGLTVVGWGCEQRSLTDEIDQTEFPALDPRSAPRGERRYAADEAAADIEAACFRVVTGNASIDAAADELGIRDTNRRTFHRSLDRITRTYDDIAALLDGQSDVVIASHQSPFNTSFDRHHSKGERAEDREALHTGSIAFKLAIRTHDVFATLTGHSHNFGYDTGEDGGPPHLLNLGYRGLSVVDITPETGQFAFTHPDTIR